MFETLMHAIVRFIEPYGRITNEFSGHNIQVFKFKSGEETFQITLTKL